MKIRSPTIQAQQPYIKPNQPWKGQWIWPKGSDGNVSNQVVLFRHCFDLPSNAIQPTLQLFACSNYRLWVNGELLGDGPCPSASHHSYVDSYDLSKLTGAKITIAVLVRTGNLHADLSGSLIAEIKDDSGNILSKSDQDWKGCVGGAWQAKTYFMKMNMLSPYQEHLDARRLQENWMHPEFNDTSWAAVGLVRGRKRAGALTPWTHLLPRPIAQFERQTFYPQRIVLKETCIWLKNRLEEQDATVEATQFGSEEEVAERIVNEESLFAENESCTLSCSPVTPSDPAWDGVRDPALTIGFEEELTAFIEIEVSAPAGAVLYIASAERLVDGRIQSMIEGRFCEKYICREGRQTFRSLNWRAFRYLRLRLSESGEEVKIHALRAIRVRTPFPRESSFKSLEKTQAIDELCRRTIRLCCVDGVFDTPWREAAQWLGDVACVTIPALHWVYGDTQLSGKFMMQASLNSLPNGLLSNLSNCQPQESYSAIPDYSLWWIYAIREHYQYSGEEGWYRMCYPEALRIMRWHLNYLDDEGFLTDISQWVFIDWADVTKLGSLSTYNAIFVMTCDVLAQMAEFNGDHKTRDEFVEFARNIRQKYSNRFWDAKRSLVVDAWDDGKQSEKVSEHGNVAALLFGCLSGEESKTLIEKGYVQNQREDWVECQPFFSRIILEALYAHGRRDLALNVIEERWGLRFRDRGWDSCLEEWYMNGSFRDGPWSGFKRTTSHAWSAGASEFLIRRLAGVIVHEPGAKKISVEPYEADFPYELHIPLMHGEVKINYSPGKKALVESSEGIEVLSKKKGCSQF